MKRSRVTTLRDFQEIKIGEKAEFTRQVRQQDVEVFSQLTGDFNPLHLDEEFARETFLRGRVVHGMLTASFISRVIGMSLPGPGAVYLSQSLRFLQPVRADETLRIVAEVTKKNEQNQTLVLNTEIFNSANEAVVAGQAEVMMPKKKRKGTF